MLKVEFLDAQYGDAVYKALSKDGQAKRIFGYALEGEGIDKKQVFLDFAKRTDPSHVVTGNPYKYLDWVCRQYTGASDEERICSEDFYKLHNDLRDFDTWSNTLHAQNKPNQIEQYQSYPALLETLQPLQQKRDYKNAERRRRSMDEEKRAKIMAETTVIYDGPEGKIVMPHTEKASIHWGDQTRWCISAKQYQNAFDSHNRQFPIIMYLPKPSAEDRENWPDYSSFKFASVSDQIFDERDSRFSKTHPDCFKRLAGAALEQLSPTSQAFLTTHGNVEKIAENGSLPEPNKFKKKVEPNPEWDEILGGLAFLFDARYHEDEKPYISDRPDLINNRDFMLYALTQNGWLQYLPQYQDDPEAVEAAMKKCELEFKHASNRLKGDKAFIMKHIGKHKYMLSYSADHIKADPEVVRESFKSGTDFQYAFPAYGSCGNSLKDKFRIFASPLLQGYKDLHDDREMVIDAITAYRYNYQYASARLRDDEELLDLAGYYQLKYASKRLRSRKDLVRKAVELHGSEFEHAAAHLKKDKDFILELVTLGDAGSHAAQYISKELLKDRDFVLKLVRANGACLSSLGEHRNDREICLEAVKSRGRAFDYVCGANYKDSEIRNAAIESGPEAIYYFDEDGDDYEQFARKAIEINPGSMSYIKDKRRSSYSHRTNAIERIFADEELMVEPVAHDPKNFHEISDRLKSSQGFAFKTLEKSTAHAALIEPHFLKSTDFIYRLLKSSEESGHKTDTALLLRNVPDFWGDFDTMTDPEKALNILEDLKAQDKLSRPISPHRYGCHIGGLHVGG